MSVWDDVVGQEPAVEVLRHAIEDPAAMTHAWLLTGPPGSGRSNAARAFAAALQCATGGCGVCHDCTTTLRGLHPDVTVVASNVDPGESDLAAMDPKEIVAAAAGGADADQAGAMAGVPQTPESQERSQRLWWYLLVAGILLLGTDTIISNRLSKT